MTHPNITPTLLAVLKEEVGIDAAVWFGPDPSGAPVPVYLVTLPPDITDAQRAEADYWLNELCHHFLYADPLPRSPHP